MPRPRHAQGRPGTQVIPADWSDTHRTVINKTHQATISVRRPDSGTGEFDRVTLTRGSAAHDPHYTGPAGITVQTGAAEDIDVAGMEVSTVVYRIKVAHDAATRPPGGHPLVGCLVHVDSMSSNGLANLTGQDLVVQSQGGGSMAWEQILLCTLKLDEGS